MKRENIGQLLKLSEKARELDNALQKLSGIGAEVQRLQTANEKNPYFYKSYLNELYEVNNSANLYLDEKSAKRSNAVLIRALTNAARTISKAYTAELQKAVEAMQLPD